MDRYFRKETAERAGASPPSEAWLFAQALLDKPVPSASAAEADARAKREQFEWLAAIAPERARELRGQLSEEADAKAQREQLEWLAAISPRHESQLRSLWRTEAERSEPQERWQRPADGSNLYEAQWDSAKHPRGGYPQNRGQWSPAAGSGSAGQPTSKPDRPGADGQPKAVGQPGVPPLMLELARA
jgi:DNA-directed RNA polymerase subunit F